MQPTSILPFRIDIPQPSIDDLIRRLHWTRWPDKEAVNDWSQGVPTHVIKDLCQYWAGKYDWRRCETRVNDLPQYKARIDDLDVHFLHVRSPHENAMPLLMMHGWPGSVLEFQKVIEPLTRPESSGGSSNDAFHLVIPSMPGYGFSDPPANAGCNLSRISHMYVRLMEALGYERWVATGIDWGADLCASLASDNPPLSLAAVHMHTAFFNPKKEVPDGRVPNLEERKSIQKMDAFDKHESGYLKLQATRPQTIGYALADSPAGQAAWILEKFYAWSDHSGDLYDIYTEDELLDNISLYWFTNSATSSARLYWEDDDCIDVPIDIPVGVSVYPADVVSAPREWGERYFKHIVHWQDVERGGHFSSMEVPSLFVREVRDCFRHVR